MNFLFLTIHGKSVYRLNSIVKQYPPLIFGIGGIGGYLAATPAVSTGCICFAFYPDLDNIGGSANPGVDGQGT